MKINIVFEVIFLLPNIYNDIKERNDNKIVSLSPQVEMAGIEPASKQGTNMLSTRLSWPSVFEQWQDPSHQPLPYLLNLILASQPTRTSPDISAPLDPISLWALAWSDVSVQHLVPKLGESTILRLRSESYSIVASYNGEPD